MTPLYGICRRLLCNPFKLKMSFGHVINRSVSSSLDYRIDRYQGAHVQFENILHSPAEFELSLAKWKTNSLRAAWLTIPIEKSDLIPVASRYGFKFHHAEGSQSTLCCWFDKSTPSALPRFATHQVGVSGCVLRDDTQEVLAVKDKNRTFSMWKFPGGMSDLGEDISHCAEREIFEETGIKSKFQGILAFRQQHNQPGAFGRSDLYYLCVMKALTFELDPCEREIEECAWMTLDDLSEGTSAITQRVIQLLRHGLDRGFDEVVMKPESFKSIYKGQVYELFSRPLPGASKLSNYLHDIVEGKS